MPPRKIPWLALIAFAAVWSLFSWRLHGAGHTPSAPFVVFPREAFYLYQAAALPLLIGLTVALAYLTLPRVAATPGAGLAFARAWANSYLVLYLLPEVGLFTVYGPEVLGRAFLVTFPLANLALFALTFLSLRGHTTRRRALLAALVGLVLVGAVLAPVVR